MNPLAHLDAPVETLVTIDFETFYDSEYSLSKMTTEAYVRDERFETIGVGVKVGDGPTVWTDDAGFRAWARQVDWSRVAVLAHHAHFDGLVLSHHYGIRPAFWLDTLSMGRALHGAEVGNSLSDLARAYAVGEKGHEVLRAIGKRRSDFTPEDYALYGEYCCNDVELTRRLLDAMIGNGFPEIELWNIDTTIRMFTEPTFLTDEKLLQDFLRYETQRKADLLARIDKDGTTLRSRDKFAELLRSLGIEPEVKTSRKKDKATGEYVTSETYAFAKTDPFMQGLLEHPVDEIRWIAEAKVALSSTLNETRTSRLISAGSRGPLPVYLKYAGAHTFRWSGADKMNFQNLERVPKKVDPEKPYAGTLRRSLRAPEGRKLVVADSNAIEARMTAWLAGHDVLVAGFQRNEDVYSRFASAVYGRPIDRKKNDADYIPGLVGKIAILGLGYQMGWAKFAMTLAAGPMGEKPIVFSAADAEQMGVDVRDFAMPPDQLPENAPGWMKERARRWSRVQSMPSRLPFEQRLVHCAVAHYLVKKYREENAPIVGLWKRAEEALHAMVDGVEMQIGPVHTVRHGIRLPNGLVMRYPGLRRTTTEDEEGRPRTHFSCIRGHGKERTHVYGGSVTENIIQALARIVVAEQLLYVRGAYGYHIVTMTHDEGVLCVPDAEAPRALERMVSAMKTAPEWAPGLPLNAEGSYAQAYGDAK